MNVKNQLQTSNTLTLQQYKLQVLFIHSAGNILIGYVIQQQSGSRLVFRTLYFHPKTFVFRCNLQFSVITVNRIHEKSYRMEANSSLGGQQAMKLLISQFQHHILNNSLFGSRLRFRFFHYIRRLTPSCNICHLTSK